MPKRCPKGHNRETMTTGEKRCRNRATKQILGAKQYTKPVKKESSGGMHHWSDRTMVPAGRSVQANLTFQGGLKPIGGFGGGFGGFGSTKKKASYHIKRKGG